MWFSKKKAEQPKERIIPRADITGFVPPELVRVQERRKSDMDVVSQLKSELTRTGVLANEESAGFDSFRGGRSASEVDEFVGFANDAAVSERDFNSAFYDADTTAYLEEQNRHRAPADDHNPLLGERD